MSLQKHKELTLKVLFLGCVCIQEESSILNPELVLTGGSRIYGKAE
jgi:hypothetical protein